MLDQKYAREGALHDLPYPRALSFVVTGTAWKWLEPGLGIEKMVADWGFKF